MLKAFRDQRWIKALTILTWSFVLTALTGFLGAAPLKVLKDICGRTGFWTVGILFGGVLLTTPWLPLGLLFLCLVILVGVFVDLEERGHGVLYSGMYSLIVTSLFCWGGFVLWIYRFGSGWYNFLLNLVEGYIAPIKQVAGVSLDPASILSQAPSGIMIFWLLSLFVALVCEERLRSLFTLPMGINHQLSWFRLPDAFVWVLITALLFSFSKFPISMPWVQMVALNVLNVMIVLYFFQGLAVVVKSFGLLRVGMFWQILFFALIVFQLFLFVSALGLVDYWLDLRVRLSRKATEWNKKENF